MRKVQTKESVNRVEKCSTVDLSNLANAKKAEQEGARTRVRRKASDSEVGGNDDEYGTYELYKENIGLDIKRVENYVLSHIIGQDEQVRQLITAIYKGKNCTRLKSNVLVMGKSGTGKTEIIKQIAKKLNIPYTIEDATKYTKEGYIGSSVSNMIVKLIENANYDLEKAKRGIIVIDEIDKKVDNLAGDVGGTDVLKGLLKIVEGMDLKVWIPPECFSEDDAEESFLFGEESNFSTSNITIICLGAFAGIDKIRDKRLGKGTIGFSKDFECKTLRETRYTKQDLIKFGIPREFAGRINSIVEMNGLSHENLVNILKKSKLSVFKIYKEELKKRGVALKCSRKLVEEIAKEAKESETGARELSNVVNYIFEKIMYDVFANPGVYKECFLELDVVYDNTKYRLIEKTEE